jgi:hypothetical protein
VLGLPGEAAMAGGVDVPSLRWPDGVDNNPPPVRVRQLPAPGLHAALQAIAPAGPSRAGACATNASGSSLEAVSRQALPTSRGAALAVNRVPYKKLVGGGEPWWNSSTAIQLLESTK